MTRTKNKKPGRKGGDNAEGAGNAAKKQSKKQKNQRNLNQPNHQPKSKKNKKKRAANEAPVADDQEDVVIISDEEAEDEPMEATSSSAGPSAGAASESKGRKDSKIHGVAQTNHEMAAGITSAFSSGRALMIRIDPRGYWKLMNALFESDSVRSKLFTVVTTCPLTNPAWITQSTGTTVHDWIILCIFPDNKQARAAKIGLEKLLEPTKNPDVKTEVSLKSLRKIGAVADSIDPDKAFAPRGDASPVDDASRDAFRVFDNEISIARKRMLASLPPSKSRQQKDEDKEIEETAAKKTEQERMANGDNVPDASAKAATSQHLPAAPPQISTTTSKTTDLANSSNILPVKKSAESLAQTLSLPSVQSSVQPSAQSSIQVSTQASTQLPVKPRTESTTERNSNTMARSSSLSNSSGAINASTLSQMGYGEIVELQTRYLGEVEPGIPVHGCILCGQHDHLWEICPGRNCEHCGDADKHVSRACPKVKKCSKCREKGHTVENCPSKLKRTAEDGFLCERCGDDTHFEEDCSYLFRHIIPETMPVKKAPFLSIFCYNCASRDHWGGDCHLPRETSKSHFDIFSNKEATKYLDASAPATNLLSEVLDATKRKQGAKSGVSIKGAASNNYHQAGYNQQPAQQPREQAVSYVPPTQRSATRQHVDANSKNATAYEKLRHEHQRLPYALEQVLTLPVRATNNRGNDGYVAYRGNQSSTLPPRPRSRSPVGRALGNYRQRNDLQGQGGYVQPAGHYDAQGAFHYQGPSRQNNYDTRAPPPPPPMEHGYEYGRSQTFHAVPPPPPDHEYNRTTRSGGTYGSYR